MGWVLDLDGVVWLAGEPIPGVVEAVARLEEAGEQVLYVTNNSSVRPTEVEARLDAIGIAAAGRVVTSAMAAAQLVEPDETVLVCGDEGVVEAVNDRGAFVVTYPPVDVVVVGYHRSFDYRRLTAAHQAIAGGARFVATNDDATYPTPRGEIPGNGALVAAVAASTGVAPVIAGKPHRPMADLVRARLGGDGIVVGDRPETDGDFARALGYRFALVLTGVTAASDLPLDPAPDLVADDLAAAVDQALDGRPPARP